MTAPTRCAVGINRRQGMFHGVNSARFSLQGQCWDNLGDSIEFWGIRWLTKRLSGYGGSSLADVSPFHRIVVTLFCCTAMESKRQPDRGCEKKEINWLQEAGQPWRSAIKSSSEHSDFLSGGTYVMNISDSLSYRQRFPLGLVVLMLLLRTR